MEKGSASAPPPIQPYPVDGGMAGGMPAAPPSYNDAMGGSGGGFAAPPPGQPMYTAPAPGQPVYPPLPQQKGMPPPQQPPVQIQQTVQYVQAPSFGHRAVQMVCPHCQASITTKTVSEPSALAWIIGGVLCLVSLWPCACIPCCIDSLQQVTHSCPNCKNFLGRYKGGL